MTRDHSGSSGSVQTELLDLDLDQSDLSYLSSLTGLIPDRLMSFISFY